MENSIPTAFVEAAQAVHATPNLRIVMRLGNLWEPGPGQLILDDLLKFFASNATRIGNLPFALRLNQCKAAASHPLAASITNKLIDGKLRIFDIDQTLGIFGENETGIMDGNPSAKFFLQESSAKSPILYYLSQGCACIFAGKSLVFEFNPKTGGPVGLTQHFMRRSEEYEVMIREHYEEWVKHDQRTKHWHDREKRILKKSTEEATFTEQIFQESLRRWLNDNCADKAQVRVELKSEASDRTDIEIIPLFGGFFVIEIKWMGKNQNDFGYGESRIGDGLRQITEYIKRGASVRKATLVAYDGRGEKQFSEIVSSKDIAEGVKEIVAGVPDRGSAFVLYLFSKHASQS